MAGLARKALEKVLGVPLAKVDFARKRAEALRLVDSSGMVKWCLS